VDTCLNKQPYTEQSARQIVLSGQVQGVGFRPFIYRLAIQHNLCGWVRNCVGIVEIHVQGQSDSIKKFLSDIFDNKPPIASPVLESDSATAVEEFDTFTILESQRQGKSPISVPSDLFCCDDCLTELNDPADRRYHYPFINCTQCGPRFTLINKLPYDRANTTMAAFDLCPQCLAEYEDPSNRRFHAEPVACPECGPSLSFHKKEICIVDNNAAAIKHAVAALHKGEVVAVKGIGGYHLMCDACDTQAVIRLRTNKPRPHKPLAILFPVPVNNPFEIADRHVTLSEDNKKFLLQPGRAIFLVEKSKEKHIKQSALSEQIAPGLNEVGIMLPYSPLHHLLLNEFDGPLVATSANISGEPVLIQNQDVEKRLSHVADAYLHHNRPIARPADDPVYRTIAGKVRPIRTGRGSAPIELTLPFKLQQPILAVGAQMKNVIVLAWENRAVISPHIGEMDSLRSLQVFEESITDLQKLYDVKAELIVCDAHPGYSTTGWSNNQKLPIYSVYHHHAHASSAYYEYACRHEANTSKHAPLIVFTWDGVGYGDDETLWGGETFVGFPGEWLHAVSMRPFNLPGGDKAGRQPWRSAAALCWQVGLGYEEIPEKDPLLFQSWQARINAPQTTSVGRLFDAAAALTGVCVNASFEGQGPMLFESLCEDLCDLPEKVSGKTNKDYVGLPLEKTDGLWLADWQALVSEMLNKKLTVVERATLFHRSLAEHILQQARVIRSEHGVDTVSFSGGVFQNRVLTELAIKLLADDGFDVFMPELIPVNDAGISFGQVMEYAYKDK